LVAGLSIPLSFVIAFTGLYLSGNTINFMSLFSLILAIGILVDSGIVVAEAIHTRIKIYGTAEGAAIASIKRICLAINCRNDDNGCCICAFIFPFWNSW